MRKFLGAAVAAVALAGCAAAPAGVVAADALEATPATAQKTIFVIRHLQKGEGADPSLTAQGAAGAQRLADILQDKKIVAIFATPTRRAMETAAPLAQRLAIPVTPYDPRNPQALVAVVAAAPGPVLVVGHSNTVPDLVAAFGGAAPAPLSDEDYGTLFAVEADGDVSTLQVN